MILAAALLLAAAPAEAPEDSGPPGHLGVGLGVGSAYAGAGAHLELGIGSFAVYGGIGLTLAMQAFAQRMKLTDFETHPIPGPDPNP